MRAPGRSSLPQPGRSRYESGENQRRAMKPFARAAAVAATVFATALAARTGAATVNSKAGPVNVESLAKLDNPWGMTFLPDGRLLISEKPGRLRFFSDGKLSDPIGGVPKVAYRGQ